MRRKSQTAVELQVIAPTAGVNTRVPTNLPDKEQKRALVAGTNVRCMDGALQGAPGIINTPIDVTLQGVPNLIHNGNLATPDGRNITSTPVIATESHIYSVKKEDSGEPPIVWAGSDRLIYGNNILQMHATVTDPNQYPCTYKWTVISQPSSLTSFTWSGADTELNPEVTCVNVSNGSSAGTYIFRLTATNSHGVSAYDDMEVLFGSLAPIYYAIHLPITTNFTQPECGGTVQVTLEPLAYASLVSGAPVMGVDSIGRLARYLNSAYTLESLDGSNKVTLKLICSESTNNYDQPINNNGTTVDQQQPGTTVPAGGDAGGFPPGGGGGFPPNNKVPNSGGKKPTDPTQPPSAPAPITIPFPGSDPIPTPDKVANTAYQTSDRSFVMNITDAGSTGSQMLHTMGSTFNVYGNGGQLAGFTLGTNGTITSGGTGTWSSTNTGLELNVTSAGWLSGNSVWEWVGFGNFKWSAQLMWTGQIGFGGSAFVSWSPSNRTQWNILASQYTNFGYASTSGGVLVWNDGQTGSATPDQKMTLYEIPSLYFGIGQDTVIGSIPYTDGMCHRYTGTISCNAGSGGSGDTSDVFAHNLTTVGANDGRYDVDIIILHNDGTSSQLIQTFPLVWDSRPGNYLGTTQAHSGSIYGYIKIRPVGWTEGPPVIVPGQVFNFNLNELGVKFVKASQLPTKWRLNSGAGKNIADMGLSNIIDGAGSSTGITLTDGGTLIGTPKATSTGYTISVIASNAYGDSDPVDVTIVVRNDTAVPTGAAQTFSFAHGTAITTGNQIVATGGNPRYWELSTITTSFGMSTGTLPNGITINWNSGSPVITGTPLAAGTINMTVVAGNNKGKSNPISISITFT